MGQHYFYILNGSFEKENERFFLQDIWTCRPRLADSHRFTGHFSQFHRFQVSPISPSLRLAVSLSGQGLGDSPQLWNIMIHEVNHGHGWWIWWIWNIWNIWNMAGLWLSINIGNVIIPTDELHHFSVGWVGIPPSRIVNGRNLDWKFDHRTTLW